VVGYRGIGSYTPITSRGLDCLAVLGISWSEEGGTLSLLLRYGIMVPFSLLEGGMLVVS
jgi:hypothetical protein